VTGVNDLHFQVSRTVRPADQGGGDRRVLGFALHALTLSRVDLPGGQSRPAPPLRPSTMIGSP
jgi:hypothetical protein